METTKVKENPLKYLREMAESSRVTSESLLKRYLRKVLGESEEFDVGEAAVRYLGDGRDYGQDVRDFFASEMESLRNGGDVAGSTLVQLRSAVKTFLLENEIEFPESFWIRLRKRMGVTKEAETEDRAPTNEELRRILSHMDSKGRALFLTLASSGMRIGEILKIKINDLNLNSDPPRVRIQKEYTKTKRARTVFMSREAKQEIEEWLKAREKFIEDASKAKNHRLPLDETRVFPFGIGNAHAIWYNAMEKCGLRKRDDKTGRSELHPHVLRKFFRTKFGMATSPDAAEVLMGHRGYLKGAYVRMPLGELAEIYKQGEHSVLVFTDGAEVTKLRGDLEESKGNMQRIVNVLTADNLELKRSVRELGKKVARYESRGFFKELAKDKDLVEKLAENEELVKALAQSISTGRGAKGEFIVEE